MGRLEQQQGERAEEDLPAWLRAELPGPPRRQGLPKPVQQEKSVSLWAIIKVRPCTSCFSFSRCALQPQRPPPCCTTRGTCCLAAGARDHQMCPVM